VYVREALGAMLVQIGSWSGGALSRERVLLGKKFKSRTGFGEKKRVGAWGTGKKVNFLGEEEKRAGEKRATQVCFSCNLRSEVCWVIGSQEVKKIPKKKKRTRSTVSRQKSKMGPGDLILLSRLTGGSLKKVWKCW